MVNHPSNALTIRPAARSDADALLTLIDALAAYEQLDPPDAQAKARLVHDGFERTPARFEVFLAFDGENAQDASPLGYAIVFETYSSFLARPTLYIEDLFILPDARRKGVGSVLFSHLAAEALRRGCGRLEWVCLEWNTLAIGFYEKRGAVHLDDWRGYRLTASQLETLPLSPRVITSSGTPNG
ncbi:MAG: GNAT family N-acetyltransferase [Cytophagales bacterium]|nr:GNAT family N-acetyltransferase [Armatimonadota bacterium]